MRSVLAVLFNSPVLIVPLKSCFSIRPSSAPSPVTDVFCIRKTWEYLTGRRGNIRTRCIVDKNGPFSSLDIEVVVVVPGDGQVPHPPVVPLRGDAAVGGCQRAVRGLEVLTLRQFVRSNPLVQIRIPEQVGGGGADDRSAPGSCLTFVPVYVGHLEDRVIQELIDADSQHITRGIIPGILARHKKDAALIPIAAQKPVIERLRYRKSRSVMQFIIDLQEPYKRIRVRKPRGQSTIVQLMQVT